MLRRRNSHDDTLTQPACLLCIACTGGSRLLGELAEKASLTKLPVMERVKRVAALLSAEPSELAMARAKVRDTHPVTVTDVTPFSDVLRNTINAIPWYILAHGMKPYTIHYFSLADGARFRS